MGSSGLTPKDLRTPISQQQAEKIIDAIDNSFNSPAGSITTTTPPNTGDVLTWTGLEFDAAAPAQPVIARTATVGVSGGVDFNSVKDAVDHAVAEGASASTPWAVIVYPGTYTEDPFTLPPGVSVSSYNGERQVQVHLVAANPLVDFITCTGGTLEGLRLSGVTDPAAALVRADGPTIGVTFTNLTIGRCSNGVVVSGGATVLMSTVLVSVVVPGQNLENAFVATGSGTTMIVRLLAANVPAAILPAYPGVNPVETLLTVESGARLQLLSSSIRIAHNTSTQVGCLVQGSSELVAQAVLFEDCEVAVLAGAAAGSPLIKLLNCDFTNNTLNVESLNSSAVVGESVSVDARKVSLASGTTLSGVVLSDNNKAANVYRLHAAFNTPTGFVDFDVEQFLQQTSSGSLYEGGGLSDGGGLNVDISAGDGVVHNDALNYSRNVSWSASSLLLPDNATRFISYQESTDALVATAGPPSEDDILLGIVSTLSGAIRYIHSIGFSIRHQIRKLYNYLYATRRVIVESGLATQVGSGATKITVNPGSYYLTWETIDFAGAVDATFSAFYGTNGATELTAQTDVNASDYDSAGVLTAMTAGYYRSDTLFLTSDGRLALIFGTEEVATQEAAESIARANPMSFIEASSVALASVVVQQGSGIASIVDRRPFGETASGLSSGVGVSDHGALTGLADDDHVQYLRGDGSRPMSGALDMGSNSITNVNTVDGVDVSAHAARHNPGGADALATAAANASQVGASPGVGVASSFSRSDHVHGFTRGTPVAIGAANAAGTSTSFVGADHVHAHGSQDGGSTHALAVASGDAGFLSGADKAKLDGVEAGATNTPLTASAPENVTKAAAAVGISTTVARSDHKHDVTTAAAGAIAIGDAASEGSATSLARSDHTHAFAAPGAPVNVTKSAASAGASSAPARADHKHDVTTAAAGTIAIGAASAEGSATSLARSDHTHALPAPAAPVNVTKAAASAGTAAEAARADHKHDVTTAAAVTVALANAEGVATSLARSDHVHRAHSGAVVQTVFAALATDVTTSVVPPTFATLLSTTITVLANSRLNISGAVVASNTNNGRFGYYRIVVDGTPIGRTLGIYTDQEAFGAANLQGVTGALAAGTRTVEIQWAVGANTGRCRAGTALVAGANAEIANLVIQELLA